MTNDNIIELENGAKITQGDDESAVWFVTPDGERWPVTDEEIVAVVEREMNIREEYRLLSR